MIETRRNGNRNIVLRRTGADEHTRRIDALIAALDEPMVVQAIQGIPTEADWTTLDLEILKIRRERKPIAIEIGVPKRVV